MGFSVNENVTQYVNHLQRAFAVDEDLAIADEGKIIVLVFVIVFVRIEHQFEARCVVGGLGSESIRRCGQQIDVGASEVVD